MVHLVKHYVPKRTSRRRNGHRSTRFGKTVMEKGRFEAMNRGRRKKEETFCKRRTMKMDTDVEKFMVDWKNCFLIILSSL
jgi:D-tyrosyl-tRNA(Tyr) deacylase